MDQARCYEQEFEAGTPGAVREPVESKCRHRSPHSLKLSLPRAFPFTENLDPGTGAPAAPRLTSRGSFAIH